MDGLTLARRVRALQKNGEITTECLPIISVSANARAEQIRMAIEAGMVCSNSQATQMDTDHIPRMILYLNHSAYQI